MRPFKTFVVLALASATVSSFAAPDDAPRNEAPRSSAVRLMPLVGLNFYKPKFEPMAASESTASSAAFNLGVLLGFGTSPGVVFETGLLGNGNSFEAKDPSSNAKFKFRSWEIPFTAQFALAPAFSLGVGGYVEKFVGGTLESGGISSDFEWEKTGQFGVKANARFHAPIDGAKDFFADVSCKIGLVNRARAGSGIIYKDRSLALNVGLDFGL